MIVDSPGIGESHKVSRQLEYYMSCAFGFIYVINISNAGGIQKDRVSQLVHINGLLIAFVPLFRHFLLFFFFSHSFFALFLLHHFFKQKSGVPLFGVFTDKRQENGLSIKPL